MPFRAALPLVATAIALATLTTLTPPAAQAARSTYPVPPKRTPVDPLRVSPAMEVPQNPERIVWKVREGGTRVIGFDDAGGASVIGSVEAGLELKLDVFRQLNGEIYYAFPFTDKGGRSVTGWVSGRFIQAASLAGSPPPG